MRVGFLRNLNSLHGYGYDDDDDDGDDDDGDDDGIRQHRRTFWGSREPEPTR